MATTYQITPGTLSSNCYPAAPQTLYNEMMEKAGISINLTGIILATSAPAVTDRDKLWIKLDGTSPVRQFIFALGKWVWPHEIPADDSRRIISVAANAAAIQALDGGDSATVGDTTGAFWEEDTNFQDRIPMGATGSLAALVGTDYGDADAQVSVVAANIPEHRHFIANPDKLSNSGNHLTSTQQCTLQNQGGGIGDQDYTFVGSDTEASIGRTSAYGESTVTAMNILNPVHGVYILKRTSRKYYVG